MRNGRAPVGQLTLLASALVATMILAESSSALAAPTITEFAGGTGPTDAVLGPEGNVWFVESTANRIGQVLPAGATTEFPVPPSNAELSGITAALTGTSDRPAYTSESATSESKAMREE